MSVPSPHQVVTVPIAGAPSAVGSAGESINSKRPRRPWITRIRFQLGAGLLVSVLAPALVRWPDQLLAGHHATLNNAVPGAMVAIVVGYYLMRRLASFPGVHAGAHILVSFAMPYGVLMALFLALRLEYSGYVLVSSFGIALIWFHGVDLASRRLIVPVLAVVPGGDKKRED